MPHAHLKLRHKRIRRVKRILRYLPRRASVHRHPILKFIAPFAKNRSQMWSFKRDSVFNAIFIGSLLACMPIYGLQMILAFIFAIIFKANCFMLVSLQWISNPLTIVPMLILQYKIGNFLFLLFGLEGKGSTLSNDFFSDPSSYDRIFASFVKSIETLQIDNSLIPMLKQIGFSGAFYTLYSIIAGGIVLGVILNFIIRGIYVLLRDKYKQKTFQNVPPLKSETLKDK